MKVKYYGDEARLDYCPVCQKTKKNPCFSVNTTNGLYTCHSSGKSGHIDEFPEIKKELGITSERIIKEEKKELHNFNEIVINSKKITQEWLDYLAGRNIKNIDNINKIIRLGKYNSMMIPLTNGEMVVGVKYRSLDKKLWSEKGSCLDYFINWQNIKNHDYLVIVEGEIDLLSALEAGVENTVSLPSGATNLKAIQHQKEWLSKFEKIIIATDNDDAGYKARDGIIEILKDTSTKLIFTRRKMLMRY